MPLPVTTLPQPISGAPQGISKLASLPGGPTYNYARGPQDISTLPFSNFSSEVGTANGFPTPGSYELPIDASGNFTNQLQKPSFDVVSPWQTMAQKSVDQGLQSSLAKNATMQGTGLKQAQEGLAMSGGISGTQMSRLADRARQNKLLGDQLAQQQYMQGTTDVGLQADTAGKSQEGYLAGQGLQTDLSNQQAAMAGLGGMNDYVQQLVQEAIKRKQGTDMWGALQ